MSAKVPDWLEIQVDVLRSLDLEGFSNLRVLVAGDFMLDEYLRTLTLLGYSEQWASLYIKLLKE